LYVFHKIKLPKVTSEMQVSFVNEAPDLGFLERLPIFYISEPQARFLFAKNKHFPRGATHTHIYITLGLCDSDEMTVPNKMILASSPHPIPVFKNTSNRGTWDAYLIPS
jgi:hypothetical protein